MLIHGLLISADNKLNVAAHITLQKCSRVKLFGVFLDTVQFCHSHFQTHIHTVQGGVQYLAQGHFGMRTGGAGDQTTDLLVSGQTALPPKPQPNVCTHSKKTQVIHIE